MRLQITNIGNNCITRKTYQNKSAKFNTRIAEQHSLKNDNKRRMDKEENDKLHLIL